MKTLRHIGLLALAGAAAALAGPTGAVTRLGVTCQAPAPDHCGPKGCTPDQLANLGNATDPKTGRKFFLDYPCDLKPGDKVVFILSIHGAGAIGEWQRHYFPALDYKDKYKLVIATPTAATAKPLRMWNAGDDEHLQNIADMVFKEFGKANIKAFWLAGHSQGGMTSNRIVCSPYFRGKVDGWLSLSGGRIGPVQVASGFGPPSPPGQPPAPPPALPGGVKMGAATTPDCDISYIFETGEKEIVTLPATSPWAEKYGCAARVREADVVDTKPGWVYDDTRKGAPVPAWGREARPGKAEVFVYPKCKGGKVVADVMRLDKGHTEGLEPKVTEKLIQMILAAPGGKAQKG